MCVCGTGSPVASLVQNAKCAKCARRRKPRHHASTAEGRQEHANTTTHTDTILSPTVSRSHLLLRRRRASLQNDICKYVGNKKMRTFRALQNTGFNVITYHAFVCTHTNRIRMQWFCDFIVSSPHLVSPDGRRSWQRSAEHTQTRQYLHTDAPRRTKEAKKGLGPRYAPVLCWLVYGFQRHGAHFDTCGFTI